MPIAGADVGTADGHKLGVVGEIRGECFQVTGTSWTSDYWLPIQHVSSTTGGVVNLTFALAAIDEYKVDQPTAA